MRINYCKNRIWNVKSERGFTLMELVMVVTVTGILSSSLVLPFISGVKQGTRPEIYATATYLAQEKIEEHRSTGYTSAKAAIDASTNPLTVTSNVTKKGRTYNEQVVTEYVTHSATPPESFNTSGSSTEYIRATVTVSNSVIPDDVTIWTILAKDFYDPDAN